MADREINIPFGPDRTGGFSAVEDEDYIDSSLLAPEDSAQDFGANDGFYGYDAFVNYDDYNSAYDEANSGKDFSGLDIFAPADGDSPGAYSESGESTAFVSALAARRKSRDLSPRERLEERLAKAAKRSAIKAAERAEYEDPGKFNAFSASFGALRDSFTQGRELRIRQKDIEAFAEHLRQAQEELEDRENILKNFDAVALEQDSAIEAAHSAREQDKAKLSALMVTLDAKNKELAALKEYHASVLEPMGADLGRAQAAADLARNDERSRKAELSAADQELRRLAGTKEATMAQAKRDQIRDACEAATIAAQQASDVLAEIQRVYDDSMAAAKASEEPLQHAIEDLEASEVALKNSITDLGEEISLATKRRQYCESVYQYPDETLKLQKKVDHDTKALATMQRDHDRLKSLWEKTRAKASKAKMAMVGIAAAAVIVVVVLVMVFSK